MTPAPTAYARVRPALLALGTALVLTLTALVAPAQAADPAPIKGRVVFPAGYTYSAAAPPRVELLVYTGVGTGVQSPTLPATVVDVAADGTFTVDRDLREGRDHVLVLHDGQHRLLDGFVSASGTTTLYPRDAAIIAPGTTGLVWNASLGVQVAGQLELPSGYTGDPTALTVNVVVGSSPVRYVYGVVRADRSFVIGGLPTGVDARLTLNDRTRVLFTGAWNSADGTFTSRTSVAAPVRTPATGPKVKLNLRGSISGRLVAPGQSWQGNGILVGALLGPDGVHEDARWLKGDGTFHIEDLDAGRSYGVTVQDAQGRVHDGLLATDESLLPVYDLSTDVAALWSRARLVRPSATEVVLRPDLRPGLRGRVVAPEGFTFDPDEPGALQIHRYERDRTTGAWAYGGWHRVEQDGTFFIGWPDESVDIALRLVPHHDVNARNAAFVEGFWAGSTRPLSTDVAGAKLAVPSTVADIVFPLAVVNVTRPTVSGTVRVGSTLRVSTGTWDPASVTTRVQWLRDGKVISGATSSSYTLKAADGGARVSVRVTASGGAGWLPTSVTSAQVSVPVPVRNVTRASISGTVAFGRTVRVQRGQWSPEPVSTSVQWLRDGVAIAGATSSSYTVVKADIGTRLSVRVVARGADGSQATSTSVSTKVAKVVPSVRVSAPSVKAGSQVKVTVQVDAGGVLSRPLGTVRVTVGSSTKTVTLKSSHVGKVTVTFAARAKGSYKVSATYTPTSSSATYLTGGTSSTVTLKVT